MNARSPSPAGPGASHALQVMTLQSLDAVMVLEDEVYPFPWTRANFVDSLAARHVAWILVDGDGALVGYCVAMDGVDEMHLLNITVAAASRRRGHARWMVAALVARCRERHATRLWLEVRESNVEGRATYGRLGFTVAGARKAYYPAAGGTREDAVVMSLAIGDAADDALD